jgi:hypothetical protein
MRIVLAAAVVLAVTGIAQTAIMSGQTRPGAAVEASPRLACVATADEELRGRVVDIQQTLDRVLADTTPASIGTSGSVVDSPEGGGPVTVDRNRLMQLRRQLDSLLGALNER